jgi:hypothetical protein
LFGRQGASFACAGQFEQAVAFGNHCGSGCLLFKRLVSFRRIDTFVPELIAVAVVALLHLWRRNNLVSIGGGAVVYMLLVQLVF